MLASIIVLLNLIGIISTSSAVTSLYIAGILLIIAELGIVSFGLIALNGIIALYAAYALQTGNDLIFGIQVGWPVLFGVAFVELTIIASVVSVHLWLRSRKTTTGAESMVGEKATVISWDKNSGSVRFEGEIWKARSEEELELEADELVTVETVNKLDLTIIK